MSFQSPEDVTSAAKQIDAPQDTAKLLSYTCTGHWCSIAMAGN